MIQGSTNSSQKIVRRNEKCSKILIESKTISKSQKLFEKSINVEKFIKR